MKSANFIKFGSFKRSGHCRKAYLQPSNSPVLLSLVIRRQVNSGDSFRKHKKYGNVI